VLKLNAAVRESPNVDEIGQAVAKAIKVTLTDMPAIGRSPRPAILDLAWVRLIHPDAHRAQFIAPFRNLQISMLFPSIPNEK
jgi:hypothetical protein